LTARLVAFLMESGPVGAETVDQDGHRHRGQHTWRYRLQLFLTVAPLGVNSPSRWFPRARRNDISARREVPLLASRWAPGPVTARSGTPL